MLTIPELAGNYIESAFQHNVQTTRSIFIAGSKSVGKTTLLHNYLDITDNPKETLTLEYSFGRKSKIKNINTEKSVCHNWEYGGRLDLLPDVLKSLNKDLANMTMVIMVDLSKPKMLWNTLETCLEAFTAQLLDRNLSIPLIIIGAKYDLFKDFDPGLKMVICSTLRCIGLIHNASIYFYSSKDPALMKRMKEIFHYYGFGYGSLTRDKIFNHNKALSINPGTDSWENIGVKECTFQDVKYTYVSRFPQDIFNEFEINKSNNQSNHVEILIDSKYKKVCDNLLVP